MIIANFALDDPIQPRSEFSLAEEQISAKFVDRSHERGLRDLFAVLPQHLSLPGNGHEPRLEVLYESFRCRNIPRRHTRCEFEIRIVLHHGRRLYAKATRPGEAQKLFFDPEEFSSF